MVTAAAADGPLIGQSGLEVQCPGSCRDRAAFDAVYIIDSPADNAGSRAHEFFGAVGCMAQPRQAPAPDVQPPIPATCRWSNLPARDETSLGLRSRGQRLSAGGGSGNGSEPPTGPAVGTPRHPFGLLRGAATDTTPLGAIRIDADSGNATQSQFCLILGGPFSGIFGFFCPRTTPSTTGQQVQEDANKCPKTDMNEARKEFGGFIVHVQGPEGGPSDCHVNFQVSGGSNYHVYYGGAEIGFYSNNLSAEFDLTSDPLQASAILSGLLVDSIRREGSGVDYGKVYTYVYGNGVTGLSKLITYSGQ